MSALDSKNWTPKQWQANHAKIRRGSLRHLLHSKQKEFYDKFHKQAETFVFSARKVGKSVVLCILGIEQCINVPGSIVKHVFPTLTLAREVMDQIMGEMVRFLPQDLQPKQYRGSRPYWVFPNGSKYVLGGADPSSMVSLRGPKCDMWLLDEIMFWDANNFDEILFGSIIPQQTLVPIKIGYATTPPTNTNHPAMHKVIPRVREAGGLLRFTIYESPMMKPEQIEALKKLYEKNPNEWRREYLAELIDNDNLRIIPEYNDESHARSFNINEFGFFQEKVPYQGYLCVDTGTKDYTAILACYYDHIECVFKVVAEFQKTQMGMAELVKEMQRMKKTYLWHCVDVKNIVDIMAYPGNTFKKDYDVKYKFPKKLKVEESIQFVRDCFMNDKVLIHKENCPILIEQLKTGMWKAKTERVDFQSTEAFGHMDLLSALRYGLVECKWNNFGNSKNYKETR